MWFKYLSNNVWRDFRLQMVASVLNGYLKYPIGESVFVVNLPLKLFRASVPNAYTASRKSLYTLYDTYLDYIMGKFESNRIIQNV